MKIAIVHDYIKEYGGAERVLEELIRIFPQAEVFTTLYVPEYLGPHKKRFENYTIHTSWFQKLPFKQKYISPLRVLSPFAFKSLNLDKFDLIITSQTGAFFPNLVKKKKNQKLICYTHTPPRYLYGYKTARDTSSIFMKIASGFAFHFLRIVDFESSKNVDQFIANSEEVKRRIEKFYRRDAIVIYPPVSVPNVVQTSGSKLPTHKYYLAGGRLARAKGMDIIVDAFVKNKKPLKVFGRGFAGFEEELMKKAGYSTRNPSRTSSAYSTRNPSRTSSAYSSSEARSSSFVDSSSESRSSKSSSRLRSNNIEFVGEVTDEEKFQLMASAKAFVFASYEEDFGITPVEAMGVGTPVIAYRSGGVKETVVDGKTGIFFDENTPESLNRAIEKFEKILRSAQDDELRNACVERSEKFSEKEFDKKIKDVVESLQHD